MGPPRANPRSSGSNPARITKVAKEPAVLAVDDNGYLAELLQKRQIEAGVWYPLLQGGSCEYTHFAKSIRDALCSVADEQVILYNGAGGTLLQSLVETSKAGELEIADISLTCGFFLKEMAAEDILPDVKQPCAGFFSVVSADNAEKQIVCPPGPAGTAVRYEVVNTALHHLMGAVTIRFRWPGEDLYVQLQVKSAQDNYATFLGLAQPRTTLLNVQIGELTQQGTFMPRIMVSSWPNAKLSVTDLNPLFNPAKWPSPPLPVDAAIAPEVGEDEAIVNQYWVTTSPYFGTCTYLGKAKKLLCQFTMELKQIAQRKATSQDEVDSTTWVLLCKTQAGSEHEVRVDHSQLLGRSIMNHFTSVDARLVVEPIFKQTHLEGVCSWLHKVTPNVPVVVAPSVFGRQADGSFLFANCIFPPGGGPPVTLASCGLSLDPSYHLSKYGIPERAFPEMRFHANPAVRNVVLRYLVDKFPAIFGCNMPQAWHVFAYSVASLHYQEWQRKGHWLTCFNTGPRASGKSTIAAFVRSMLGFKNAALSGSVTEYAIAQQLEGHGDMVQVIDDMLKEQLDVQMIGFARKIGERSRRFNKGSDFTPGSPLLVSARG